VEVQNQNPGINTIIRPCLIVGPLDRTDRFTYWPARIDKGGEVLAPNTPDDPCQFIDSRDLAEWTIRMAEMREFGTCNAIGPEKPLTISEIRAHRGLPAAQRSEGAHERPDLPPARRHGERHARLAQDALGRGAGRDARGQDQRAVHEAGSRGARGVEGGVGEAEQVRSG
jgi:nucleoside-diphosphate-sugar epimerase